MSEQKHTKIQSWEIEKAFNDLVDEWMHLPGEKTLQKAAMVIKRLKKRPKICEDCGKNLDNPQTYVIKKMVYPMDHWSTLCSTRNCMKYQHPETGEFSLGYLQLREYYFRILKRKTKKD